MVLPWSSSRLLRTIRWPSPSWSLPAFHDASPLASRSWSSALNQSGNCGRVGPARRVRPSASARALGPASLTGAQASRVGMSNLAGFPAQNTNPPAGRAMATRRIRKRRRNSFAGLMARPPYSVKTCRKVNTTHAAAQGKRRRASLRSVPARRNPHADTRVGLAASSLFAHVDHCAAADFSGDDGFG